MDSPLHVRVCPACDEEFRPDIGRCSDCGGPLADRYLDSSGRPLGEVGESTIEEGLAPAPLPEAYAPLTIAASAADLRRMAAALDSQGVPFQVRFEPDARAGAGFGTGRFLVFVHQADRVRGLSAIRPFLGHEASAHDSLTVETSFDATRYVRCPACEAALGADAAECPECGLVVASDRDAE